MAKNLFISFSVKNMSEESSLGWMLAKAIILLGLGAGAAYGGYKLH